MALEWPDFTQATITDAETFDALKRAYAERCAAASAGAGHAVPDDAEYWGADVTPDLDRLVSLRNAIRSLAPKFVRLEDERYRWKSWVNFPIAYTGADLMKGEHSLAILPAPGISPSHRGRFSILSSIMPFPPVRTPTCRRGRPARSCRLRIRRRWTDPPIRS